jgi:cell division transport system permease protein
MGSESDFLDGLDGSNPLPGSVELKLKSDHREEDRLVRLKLDRRSYVTDVIAGSEWIEHTQGVLNVLRFLGVAISLILLFVMVFLISNTIRLVVLSREREIEIMRLVGATKEFVQVPYILGGALQGFLGSMIGLMLLSGIYLVLNSEFVQIREVMAALPELKYLNRFIIIFLVFGGTVVGGLGSYFATRKLVDV